MFSSESPGWAVESVSLFLSFVCRCSVLPEVRLASDRHYLAPGCVYAFGRRNILDYSCVCAHVRGWMHVQVQVEAKGLKVFIYNF